MEKFTILGGSSPFTIKLVDLLCEHVRQLPKYELCLLGRNWQSLEKIQHYSKLKLEKYGWKVTITDSYEVALQEAHIVLHQIRYRGLKGREKDEKISLDHHLVPDETLGASGLHSAIMSYCYLQKASEKMLKYCPDAWIINLTNPLCFSTTLFAKNGLKKCVGLCELPYYTLLKACDLLQININDIEWSYQGLNHRGMISNILYDRDDVMSDLISKLLSTNTTIEGVSAQDIVKYNALPLKYFKLFSDKSNGKVEGRAHFLSDLREKIFSELDQFPNRSPIELRNRYMEWYPLSVMPFLIAISSKNPSIQVVNKMGKSTEVAQEFKAYVSSDGIEALPCPPLNNKLEAWLNLLEKHEIALHRAAYHPTRSNIVHALELDPAIPSGKMSSIADSIFSNMTYKNTNVEV